jgi:hypothetical protein
VAAHDLIGVHQFDLSRISQLDRSKVRLLEISVDPERIGVDERNGIHTDIDVVANWPTGSSRNRPVKEIACALRFTCACLVGLLLAR